MSSSKCFSTIRYLLCYVFISVSFFLAFSSGFTWIQTARPKTDAEIGKSVTLRWHYNLTENETHYQSDLIWRKENKDVYLATRQADKATFIILASELYTKFTVNGSNNILFIVPNVQIIFDGSFCLKLMYHVSGLPMKRVTNCGKLFTFDKPEIQYISSDQTQPEGTTVLLYCNASGNPIPNVTWSKKDSMGDTLIHGQGHATLQLTNITSAATGEYHCTATNMLGKTFNMTILKVHSPTARPPQTSVMASTSVVSSNTPSSAPRNITTTTLSPPTTRPPQTSAMASTSVVSGNTPSSAPRNITTTIISLSSTSFPNNQSNLGGTCTSIITTCVTIIVILVVIIVLLIIYICKGKVKNGKSARIRNLSCSKCKDLGAYENANQMGDASNIQVDKAGKPRIVEKEFYETICENRDEGDTHPTHPGGGALAVSEMTTRDPSASGQESVPSMPHHYQELTNLPKSQQMPLYEPLTTPVF